VNAPDSISHEEAVELLPWLVNGSMDAAKQAAVQNHAQSCVVCRRELKALKALRDFVEDQADAELIPSPDMRNINARIDRMIDKHGWSQKLSSWLRSGIGAPWKLAFVAQTILVIVLTLALALPTVSEPEFTTLTRPESLSGSHHVRVVFNPETTLAEVTALLEELALEVETGPTARGVYTLALTAGTSAQELEQLLGQIQSRPSVQFAQPVVHSNPQDP